MIGKKLKLNDYKLTYGQGTININLYSAFKYKKNGNKYAIYNYENNQNKLFYGSFFARNGEATIMTSKEDPKDIVKEFINLLLEDNLSDEYEIISLDKVNSVQIIDEYTIDYKVDIEKIYDLTIPKPVIEEIKEQPKKKPMSIATIFFTLFIAVLIAFFFVNPEVIKGKNKYYTCTKTYYHDTLPASVNEQLSLVFNGKGNINSIEVSVDYVFNDTDYYEEFKSKSYFYKYIEEGDTYKFIDENYTYRLFSNIDTTNDFFLPTEESELVSYYKDNNYTCKAVEVNE